MEEYGRIRRAHRDGMSIREIAREFHHSRYKVREVLRGCGEPQKYSRRETQNFPKLALVVDRIREILKVDESAPPKQRHTAMRLFERLRDEHGYKGGYDTVRRFVQQHRGKQRETFIPLDHAHGQRMEADFGKIYVDFPEGRKQVSVLILVCSCSNAPFAMALPTERTESILEGMRQAFEFFGCVPREVWWDNPKIDGRLTRAALILLGKAESTHHVAPAQPRMTWILKDDKNIERDYRHYDPPFLLAVDELLDNVRNLTIRYLPDGTLFPVNVSQYDPWVMRETLHNCIAHQDYEKAGRIIVVEQPDSLLFTNLGAFYPGSVEEVVVRDSPQEFSANPLLAQAMVSLNMIDTIGSGIKRTFQIQRDRNFPMPTYDLTEPERVKVRLIGQILDPNYTRMLMSQTNLDLLDVIALDKVQKQVPISDEELKSLRTKKLIEGRRPNLHVSADVAAATDTMVDYLNKRGIDKNYCQRMVIELLQKQREASRQEIVSLLIAKLSDALDTEQKKNFVQNLLQEMRRDGVLAVEGTKRWAKWRLM